MSKVNMSPAETYAIQLENEEPGFFSMIPHILDDLTYDYVNPKTGKTEISRLSVYAKELYRALKSIGGNKNISWKSRNNLADHCNMSAGMITKCKKELSQNFHQLDNTPLIQIKKILKPIIREGVLISKATQDTILILNIWKYNNAYMSIRSHLKSEEIGKGRSPHDIAYEGRSPHDLPQQGAVSPGDTNNNPNNKNPLFKEQQPTAKADSVVSSNKEKVFPSDSEKIYAHLIENGCTAAAAKRISKNTNPVDFKNACDYMINQMRKNKSKGKDIPNKWGYFQTILTERYWEKK